MVSRCRRGEIAMNSRCVVARQVSDEPHDHPYGAVPLHRSLGLQPREARGSGPVRTRLDLHSIRLFSPKRRAVDTRSCRSSTSRKRSGRSGRA